MSAESTMRTVMVGLLALSACTKESRVLGPTPPQTAPAGPHDPRIVDYLGNANQVNQGARYFSWYGCTGCHDASAPALRSAKLPVGVPFDAVYRAIADGHGGLDYGRKVPVEQLWQLTAFVSDLPNHTPDKRRRQSVDTGSEPAGATWSGPLR